MPTFQKEITEQMRAVLVDWLQDVHLKFKLRPETLFLAVNMMDRYIEKATITRKRLQLVGITCLFIAAKYEEIYPPPLKDFVYVTDRAYKREDLLDMEGKIISALQFKLTVPTSLFFFERFAKVAKLSEKAAMLGRYILESSLLEFKTMRFNASSLATAAVSIASKVESKEGWNKTISKSPSAEDKSTQECSSELLEIIKSNEKRNLTAIRRKYSTMKYLEIARVNLKSL